MKNRKAKKGFTIIELVIVIAVIGILAGVLIPTFSNVINNANETAAMENAKNAYTSYLADNAAKSDLKTNICIKSGNYYFHVVNGQFGTPADTDFNGKTDVWTATVGTDGTLTFGTSAAAHTAHTTEAGN